MECWENCHPSVSLVVWSLQLKTPYSPVLAVVGVEPSWPALGWSVLRHENENLKSVCRYLVGIELISFTLVSFGLLLAVDSLLSCLCMGGGGAFLAGLGVTCSLTTRTCEQANYSIAY